MIKKITAVFKARKNQVLSIVLAACLMVGMIPQISLTAKAASLPGARSESNSSGDVFLGGNYIEVGISKHGSFGTSTVPTSSSFHPATSSEISSPGLGLSADGDGWDVGKSPNTGDFFLPGTPEERWMLGYEINGTKYEYCADDRKNELQGSWSVEPTVSDTSDVSKNQLSATLTGVTQHGVKIKITYSFGVNDKYFTTDVDIQNTGSYNITNTRFLRSFDPDQDAETTQEYSTYNKVACNPLSTDSITAGGDNNFAMVVAKGGDSKEGFFFIAFDERARASILDGLAPSSIYGKDYYSKDIWCDNTSVPTYATTADLDGISGYLFSDVGIALTFNIGTINTGKTDSLSFYSSLDPDVSESLATIRKAASGAVDYSQEKITDLEPNGQYTLSYDDGSGSIITINVVADADGTIPLTGTGTLPSGGTVSYDLTGKAVTITPIVAEGEVAIPQDIEVAARPNSPDAPSVPVTVEKPESVTADSINTSTDSITVVNPTIGQEYSIDNGVSWKKYTGTETITFTGLSANTSYTVLNRISASASAPASLPESVTVKTQVMIKNITKTIDNYTGVYDGAPHSISVSVPTIPDAVIEYSETEGDSYSAANPQYTDVGSHTVYFRISKEGYYPSYGSGTVNISSGDLSSVAVEQKGELIYNGSAQKAEVNANATSINSSAVTFTYSSTQNGVYGEMPSFTDAGTYTVYYKANAANHKEASGQFSVTIKNAAQQKPELTANAETISKKADGTITGLTTAMEYSKTLNGSYTKIYNTSMTFEAGTYYVRYAAKTNYDASPAKEVTVEPGKKLAVTVPASQTGYTLTADKSLLDWHESVTFTFSLKPGYQPVPGEFATEFNGTTIAFYQGEFTAYSNESDAVLTIEGIGDLTAPNASITVDTNHWSTLLHNITFGLFFKETQTVTVTAADFNTGSGIDSVKYYLAPAEIADPSTITGWQDYNGSFNIDPDNECIIYVKTVDKAGNVNYVSSTGLVINNTPPVINGIENNGSYYGDTNITVSDSYLDELYIDNVKVTDLTAAHTITADNGQHTVKATDKSGNVRDITFKVYKIYTVTFAADGNTVATVAVNHGATAVAPTIPAKKGYTDTAPVWDKSIENITADTTITAVYTKNDPGIYEKVTPVNNAGSCDTVNTPDELKEMIPLTPEEKDEIESGEDVKFFLDVKDVSTTVSVSDKKKAEEKLDENKKLGMFLDINLFKQIGSDEAVKVPNTNGKIKVTFKVPENLLNKNNNITRTYQIIRIHNNVATYIDAVYNPLDNTVTFETDKFSTYALAYSDTANKALPQTGDNSNLPLWITLLLASGAAIALLALTAKKRRSAAK